MYRSINIRNSSSNRIPKERALADLERAISAAVRASDDDIIPLNVGRLGTKSVTTCSTESPESVALTQALGLPKTCQPVKYHRGSDVQRASTTARGDWVSSSTSPCSKSEVKAQTRAVPKAKVTYCAPVQRRESFSERRGSTARMREERGELYPTAVMRKNGPKLDNVQEMSPVSYALYKKACAEKRRILREKRTEMRRRSAEIDMQKRNGCQGAPCVPSREIRARRNRESAIKSRIKAKARDAQEKTLLAQLKSDNVELRNAVDIQKGQLENQRREIQQLRAILQRSRI